MQLLTLNFIFHVSIRAQVFSLSCFVYLTLILMPIAGMPFVSLALFWVYINIT